MIFSFDPVNNLENLIAKNKTKNKSIYLVIVLGILVFLVLLPVIKIDIRCQSRGLVNGKVTFVKIKNNSVVQKGKYFDLWDKQNLL